LNGQLDLKAFLAEALRRGDECHNRNKAGTASLIRELAPSIAKHKYASEVFDFLKSNDHFALNVSIAASKCSADAAHSSGIGTIVTALAANGVDFGIKVSGGGDRWFTAPSLGAEGVYFDGFGASDGAKDMG